MVNALSSCMPKKTLKLFPTPSDCEAAFYDAIERADLNLMSAVWADDSDAICIQPHGPRLAGFPAIRASFAAYFSVSANPGLKISEYRRHDGPTLAIHSVYETFMQPNGEPMPPFLATNAYILTPNGWRMILHHASPSPRGTTAEEQGVARILH